MRVCERNNMSYNANEEKTTQKIIKRRMESKGRGNGNKPPGKWPTRGKHAPKPITRYKPSPRKMSNNPPQWATAVELPPPLQGQTYARVPHIIARVSFPSCSRDSVEDRRRGLSRPQLSPHFCQYPSPSPHHCNTFPGCPISTSPSHPRCPLPRHSCFLRPTRTT